MVELSVRLTDRAGGVVERVLVHVDVFSQGNLAWSTVLGLTDERGQVTIDNLEREYREDQRRFPMDYKLPFAELDQVQVGVAGGDEFRLLAKGAESPIVEPQFRRWWREARNSAVTSGHTECLELQTSMHVNLMLEL